MEEFHREIYAVNGITQIKFPEHYPVSRLQVEEQACWNGVRLEAQTDFCWLSEQPLIYEAAARGLAQVESPLPMKFPLPNPRDLFSWKPGSILLHVSESK
ncbi:hypothetical protein EUGRSUZ_H04286 [Eucalyptus grandis]|uniref:Uncharacterized protein n=2 Tax=Eucalyptus grandis TaxID=71139 RepID=A0ACC3JWL0_EUCGR|nr:hypothetical protein EUGRSUZ_H04286 [Eucalyptus grandis]